MNTPARRGCAKGAYPTGAAVRGRALEAVKLSGGAGEEARGAVVADPYAGGGGALLTHGCNHKQSVREDQDITSNRRICL
jgi:hypothetical protein